MNIPALTKLIAMGLRGRRLLGTTLFVIVIGLASAAVVTGLESRRSAERVWNGAFDEARAPHVILRARTSDALAAASKDERVVARSTVEESAGRLAHGGETIGVAVRSAAPDDLPAVGAPHLVKGRLARGEDEVALERSFALDVDIEIEDEVTITSPDGKASAFTVVGHVLDFQDCFWPGCDPGVVWTTPQGQRRLGSPTIATSLLRLRDGSSASAVSAEIFQRHGRSLIGVQDWVDTRRDSLGTNRFFGAFLSGFGIFVMVAAGVVVAGSVTNRVMERRRDIGLVKAIGVTPMQMVGAITIEHALLAAIGLVGGWLAGVVLAPNTRIGVLEVLEPTGRGLALSSLLLAAIAVLIIVAITTALPAWRFARQSTSTTLRLATSAGRGSRLARIASVLGAGPVVTSGLKDVFSRPVRAILAALSVVLAIVALTVTLGVDHATAELTGTPSLVGDPWDATVTVQWANSSEDGQDGQERQQSTTDVVAALTAAIERTPGAQSWYSESAARRVVDGQVVLVRAIGGDPDTAGFDIQQGRAMRVAGEAIAGYGLLERLGRRVGDRVVIEVDEVEIPVTIVGRYGETEDSGEVLQVRSETLSDRFPQAVPDAFRVRAQPGITPSSLAARLSTALQAGVADGAYTGVRVEALTIDTEDLDTFRMAFWLVAMLVLVVALANVGSTMLLGVRERLHDLGVLRAVGFTPRQLIASTAVGTIALASLAVLVGVPAGLLLNRALLRSVGEGIGYGPELGLNPQVLRTTMMVALLAGGTAIVGTIMSLRYARSSASELIRYE